MIKVWKVIYEHSPRDNLCLKYIFITIKVENKAMLRTTKDMSLVEKMNKLEE